MSERPFRVWSWLALAAAVLAVLLCLAALVVQRQALPLRPLWRGDQFADPRLRQLLRPAMAAALLALVVGWLGRGRMRGRDWKLLLLLVLALPSFIGAYRVSSWHYRRVEARSYCLSNVKNMAIVLSMYEQDYSAFPSADHWQDALTDYLKADALYQCSQVPEAKSAQAMNSQVAGLGMAGIGNPGRLVSVFESDQGWNASGGPEVLPTYPRHGGVRKWQTIGDNYGFVDGHAKWYVRPHANGQDATEPRWLKVAPNESVTWQPTPAGGKDKPE